MRTVPGYVVVSAPDLDAAEECPECGFDALLTFPLHVISEAGVSQFGTTKACGRCAADRSGA